MLLEPTGERSIGDWICLKQNGKIRRYVMGSGSWSSGDYVKSAKTRKVTGVADFGYHDDVMSGKKQGIHETLDPRKMVDGIRESRDSDEHPESLPIIIIFDVTGSMGGIPKVLQKKLTSLMDVIVAKAEVVDPQILVGAVGDFHVDHYPLQVGQFESDNRFDEQLRNIILEGGGGGQGKESYGLAFYFAARHTVTDSFEKRGKKGYLFTMGDEAFWPRLTSSELHKVFNDDTLEKENVVDLIHESMEKWEVFHLFAVEGSYAHDDEIHRAWQDVLGERFVKVENSDLVCEIIAGLVYALETAKTVDDVVMDMALQATDGAVVKNAIMPVIASRLPSHIADGNLPRDHQDVGGSTTAV